jgi:hypothetical protein
MPRDITPISLTPEQKIKALQVQLKEANEKAQLFEAVLDVLEKDYGPPASGGHQISEPQRFVNAGHPCRCTKSRRHF